MSVVGATLASSAKKPSRMTEVRSERSLGRGAELLELIGADAQDPPVVLRLSRLLACDHRLIPDNRAGWRTVQE